MGYIDSARVDGAALLAAAQRFEAIAAMLEDATRRCQASLTFDGRSAGRGYTDCGDDVRRAVADTVARVRSWAAVNQQIADGLRISAADYADIDARAARRIG